MIVRSTVSLILRLAAAAGLVAIMVPAAAAPPPAPGGGPGPEPLPAAVAAAPARAFRFKGTELCVRCHRSEQGDWIDASTTDVWRHDAHSRAHLDRVAQRRTGPVQLHKVESARRSLCVQTCRLEEPLLAGTIRRGE